MQKKINGRNGLRKRGMLALSVLLIAALIIPQAALATNQADGHNVQAETILENDTEGENNNAVSADDAGCDPVTGFDAQSGSNNDAGDDAGSDPAETGNPQAEEHTDDSGLRPEQGDADSAGDAASEGMAIAEAVAKKVPALRTSGRWFQFQVTVTEADKTFIVPTSSNLGGKTTHEYNWDIDFGDDSEVKNYSGTAAGNGSGISHDFPAGRDYIITISPHDPNEGAWLAAFGFANGSSNATSVANKNKITKVLSPLTPDMTRKADEITTTDPAKAPSQEWNSTFLNCTKLTMGSEFTFDVDAWKDVKAVNTDFARSMFNGCSGAAFTMNSVFTMPQNLTAVGDNFVYYMFSGCSGAGFTMNSVFTMPQGLTSVGDNFVAYMFSSCKGNAFTMNDVFNLPQGLTKAGKNFANNMFTNCNGTGFTMGKALTMPQRLENVGDSFASNMFSSCKGNAFTMNDIFNLPQNLVSTGTFFAASMFTGCSGTAFTMNNVFTMPQSLMNVDSAFALAMFDSCAGKAFTMNNVFNLPQSLTSVKSSFATQMFYKCSGDEFTMNSGFNLPQGLMNVGTNFAQNMFYECSGNAFTMNDIFNLPQGFTSLSASSTFAVSMFNGCKGNTFTMNDIFNLPQKITYAPDDFATSVFANCSGDAFAMNAIFNLPQNITGTGRGFAESMFAGCSGEAFIMTDIFNLPQNITTAGYYFAKSMFRGCGGNAFTMNNIFNLPQRITSTGDSFFADMFNGCCGNAFTMNDIFNLPQNITNVSGNSFAARMFMNCNGTAFTINNKFTFPQNSALVATSRAYETTFSNIRATSLQNRTIASIINGNPLPGSPKWTFSQAASGSPVSQESAFVDWSDRPVNWGCGGGGGILASDFSISLADAAQFDSVKVLTRSSARVVDGNGVNISSQPRITVNREHLDALIGAKNSGDSFPLGLSVSDGTYAGKTFPVRATVYDVGDTSDPASKGSIFANHFSIALSEAKFLTSKFEAIAQSGVVATNKSGIPVSAQNINIDSYQLYVIRTATGNGVFPLKFSIADGAAVTVDVTVYDKGSAGAPAVDGTIFVNDFRLSVASAQALTGSAAVRHSGAVAKDKNGVAVLPANIKTDVDELAAINAATDNCILPLTFSIEDGAEVTVDVTVYDKGSAGAPAVDGTIFANDFRIALSAASDLTADEAITKSGAVATDAKGLAVVPANIEADADELAAIKAKTTAKDAVFPLTFRIADGASVQIKVTVSDDRYADYVVQHYMISSAGIRLRMSETNTGEIDSLVSAVPRVYIGYRHDPKYADAKLNGTVTADGKLVLKLYYRINTYIVTFSDYDGTALKKQAVEYRGDAQAPANPSRSGYTFTGWDKAASAWTGVTSNVTVTALYVKNSDSSGNAGDNGGSGGGNNGGSGGDNNGSTGNGGNENNGNGNGGNGNNGNGNGGNGNNGSVNGGNGNGSNGNGGNGNNGNGNGNANSGGSNNGGSGGGAGNGAGGTDVAAPQQAENPAVDIEPSETPLSGAGSDTRIETPDTPKASALPGIIAAAKQQGIPVLFGGARGADGSIADGGIPLTKPDGYRAWALANLIVAAAGVLLAVIFLARAFARREDETSASAQRIVKMPWLIAGTALAAIGMILFFLTEDVRLNMVLADGWSVVNAAAIAAEAVALKLAFGRGKASA